MSRGFIISVDALLSVVILFTLLTLSFDALRQDGSGFDITRRLDVISYHVGDSLETSGTLSDAVILDDTTRVREFLDGLPYSVCSSVSVKNGPDANASLFNVSKSGCSTVLGESVSSLRGFIVADPPDANLYVATVTTWVNRGDA